ncbi:hypothetical protein [Kribbia dieselivorans]|uniref:hypothetical protein n=1 Tax=Kribbia dieselivorans TaxID=331526 RepID=UPI000837DB1A|nr:hypothetical protein [Kribbia dieselivorans]
MTLRDRTWGKGAPPVVQRALTLLRQVGRVALQILLAVAVIALIGVGVDMWLSRADGPGEGKTPLPAEALWVPWAAAVGAAVFLWWKRRQWRRERDDRDSNPTARPTATASGRVTFFIITGLLFAWFAGNGVVFWVQRDAPVVWGTFTQTSSMCGTVGRAALPRRCGPGPTGRWVSDDRSVVRNGIRLGGLVEPWSAVGEGSTVRAGWRPQPLSLPASEDSVATSLWIHTRVWQAWAAAGAVVALACVGTWRAMKGSRAGYRGRHGPASDV